MILPCNALQFLRFTYLIKSRIKNKIDAKQRNTFVPETALAFLVNIPKNDVI